MFALKTSCQMALALIDLTSLNDNDTDETVGQLCTRASQSPVAPAALCISAGFVTTARNRLQALGMTHVQVATVANFPQGNGTLADVVDETVAAIKAGADEIDVVFPYRALLAGDAKAGEALVAECKAACGERLLKVIIETGELKTAGLIQAASEIAIAAGADFVKTSTGKVAVNATLDSARTILATIKSSGVDVGFKAAGGIRTPRQAQEYIEVAARIMGEQWLDARHFRLGASALFEQLLPLCADTKIATQTSACTSTGRP